MPSARWMPRACSAVATTIVALACAAAPALGDEPVAADQFVDSIGVNVHLSFTDTPYWDFETVSARLDELGVKHVRDSVLAPNQSEWDSYVAREWARRMGALVADGRRATLIAGRPDGATGTMQQNVSILAALGAGVAAVEGPNEWDVSGRTSWRAELADYQEQLNTAVRAAPALSASGVLGPSFAQRESYAAFGDQTAFAERGNLHAYSGAAHPEQTLDSYLDAAGPFVGAAQPVVTEAGFHTAVGANHWWPAVDEHTAGTYTLRMFLENFRRGIHRTFAYELVDQRPNAARDNPESNFGLLRSDFSPKPAFSALRNLIGILTPPASSTRVAGPGGATVSNPPADLRHLVFRRSDGSLAVALWRAVPTYDVATKSRLDVAPAPVALSIPCTATAEAYAPGTSPDATPLGSSNTFDVSVDGEVTVVEFGECAQPVQIAPAAPDAGVAAPAEAVPATEEAAPAPSVGDPAAAQVSPVAPTRSLRAGRRSGVHRVERSSEPTRRATGRRALGRSRKASRRRARRQATARARAARAPTARFAAGS